MTITTAELPHPRTAGAGLAPALKLAPLALAAMLLSAECRADWKVTPLAELRETYSTNVATERDDVAHNSFVTEAAPGLAVSSNGPRLTLNASAQWRVFSYSNKEAPNVQDSDRRYQADARAMLVDEFLYVDAGAGSQRQNVSAFGPLAGNPYSGANRTQVSTWRISPYLRHRFGNTATATARFTRDSVDSSYNGFGSSVASTTLLDLSSGTSSTNLGWNVSYNRQEQNNRIGGRSSLDNGIVGLRYRVLPHLSLTASAGYDSYDYASLNDSTSGASWSAGFVWTPSTRTSVQASFGHRYFGKTGALDASHRTRHTVWSATYSDEITTTRSQFLLPAAFDTAAMLDGMFASAYPDPVQRRAAIQAYMAAAGLPASLADSINFLSNRYVRAKRLQFAAVLRGARSNLALSVFQDQRAALSLQQSDSALLGNQLASINDNVRQRGASADAEYRLSTRTTMRAGVYAVRAQSLDTGVASTNRRWQVGMNRQIDRHVSGVLELRHVVGSFGVVSNDRYHENAIAAALSVQY
ncbi:TIGR03016 family PEP-CTERM system-associated outer membrane protein [uncultured Massilia sp.]|uniref:TIGR03016 family PEP-CTERM system-associated outer membrane protein n=1 Tax=uncultured Massilia sp. TaxID=169973 RepID=UPI0025EABDE2|nr:TIGR03016 family PEP-CTERM system-associated outer membrane protein [uncultured Massilia sp.]